MAKDVTAFIATRVVQHVGEAVPNDFLAGAGNDDVGRWVAIRNAELFENLFGGHGNRLPVRATRLGRNRRESRRVVRGEGSQRDGHVGRTVTKIEPSDSVAS